MLTGAWRRVRGSGWLALGLALAAGACTTVDPATGAHEVALPGAASHAVVAGWISGDAARQSLNRAALAAGIGGLAVGSSGYYMDVQESKLREQLDGSGVGVVRKGNDLTLNLPASLVFAAEGPELNPAAARVLDVVAAVLHKYEKTVIEVAGHTDGGGSREQLQALSERRATAVAAYLEQHGVRKLRIIAVGAGETRPVAVNDSAGGRAANRRVELTLSPVSATRG